MTTIIKIVVALALLTMVFQAGMAALTNYQFEDAVHEALLFAPTSSDAEIVDTVQSLASNQGLTVESENILIRQVGPDLHVNVTYDTQVPLIPGIFIQKWTFDPSATIRLMPGVRRSPR